MSKNKVKYNLKIHIMLCLRKVRAERLPMKSQLLFLAQ